MKQKEFQKISLIKNPYYIFTREENAHPRGNILLKTLEPPEQKTVYNKKIFINPLITYKSRNSKVSSISSSLKKVALNSKLYGNYIDYYVNLTQENYFKIPSVEKYPLLKNKDYLSVKLQNLTNRIPNDTSKENLYLSKSNTIFISGLDSTKIPKNYNQKQIYELNYTKYKFSHVKKEEDGDIENDLKDFSELCYENLFESKFMKKNKIKNIDINNCFIEKQKNFKFFQDYIKKVAELKDIFNENNYHRNTKFSGRTVIKKEKMEFTLDIYSLCFKFFSLNDNNNDNNNKQKESQKLYFPFILMPFFYLLDFTSFKVLLSEIIIYNKNKGFEFVKEKLLIKILEKYICYIENSLENKNNYTDNITYNKNETIFPYIYDWIIIGDFLNEEKKENNNNSENSNNNYKCYKLKIVLPKIKFKVDNLKLKINKLLNKQIIANLLENKFKNWKKLIFFDLFSTKRFKLMMNIIMLNMHYKITLKKINLNQKYNRLNKDYEFFLTKIGENNSLYYGLIPYIILMIIRQNKKKFQKINLNLKNSINLNKYKKYWGIINTLFKCMYFDKMKNHISFKLDLLEGDDNEKPEDNIEDNIDINDINNNNPNKENMNNTNPSKFMIRKATSKNKSLREKETNNVVIKYKDKNFSITLLNYTLRKINITSINSEEKYLIVPPKLLNDIMSIKDDNKIINLNCSDIPIIAKYIGENSKYILFAKESNNIAEEKRIKEKTKEDKEIKLFLTKKEEVKEIKKSELSRNKFNILRSKTLKPVLNYEEDKTENKKEEDKTENKKEEEDEIKRNINAKKRFSTKYVFPQKLFFDRDKKRKVTITNMLELNKNRFENTQKEQRRTLVAGELNF